MNRDFRDMLHAFNEHHVDYLVVGAHALAVYGHVRATKDLDLWIRPSLKNAGRVLQALRAFKAPLHDLTEMDLATVGTIFQIGVAPVRIDLLTSIDGVDFAKAWAKRGTATFVDQTAPIISREHLIQNKQSCGRTQDLADVEALMRRVDPKPQRAGASKRKP